jgi:hypothetical protein
MERGGNDAAAAAANEMPGDGDDMTVTTTTHSAPVLPRALAPYVVPATTSGITRPSMLRPG